jgi:microcystin degradation protein MlrC
MTVSVRWYDNDKTAVVFRFVGKWTWEEYFASRKEMRALQDTVNHLVDHIYDFQDAVGYAPTNVITNFAAATRDHHPNTSGIVVAITNDNAFFNTIARIFLQLYHTFTSRHEIVVVKTRYDVDEALDEQREKQRRDGPVGDL